MTKPLFVINWKAYDESFGDAGLKLAKAIDEAARIKGMPVILCVPATEIRTIAAAVKCPVYSQHVDAIEPGSHTGYLPAKAIAAAGAKGTLINHSEHRVEHVEKAVSLAKEAGLEVIICARDAVEVKIYRNLPVQFIAVEPPELIGGDVSISAARPELISASVKHCPDKLLIGAGVKNRADVEKGMALGAKGVLIASGVVKAASVKDALFELFTGWDSYKFSQDTVT